MNQLETLIDADMERSIREETTSAPEERKDVFRCVAAHYFKYSSEVLFDEDMVELLRKKGFYDDEIINTRRYLASFARELNK